ncbi:MAG: hypothetical protein WAO09_05545 [Candidatus Dormiibacterota bacterium]
MNYQDFESAWYLGLIITSFFCVMLTGVVVVLRHARRLATEQGQALAVLMVSASIFTFLFLLGLCLALLIGIVVLAGG